MMADGRDGLMGVVSFLSAVSSLQYFFCCIEYSAPVMIRAPVNRSELVGGGGLVSI